MPKPRLSTRILLVAGLGAAIALPVPPASAASIVVDTNADTAVAADGDCSLREAINNANGDADTTGGDCAAGSGLDAIAFSGVGTITLGSSLPSITDTDGLTIDGDNAVTVDGAGSFRVFSVNAGAALTLQDITVANGNAGAGFGGGISNDGTLTVSGGTLSTNGASQGGGIYNASGTVTVTGSTLSGNTATGNGGGAIFNTSGTVTVLDSTLSGNTASLANGGGIRTDGGTLSVLNSTLSGNTAEANGGAIASLANAAGSVTLTNSTLSGNSANLGGGGGIYNQNPLTIVNCTLSANSAPTGGGGGIINFLGTLQISFSTLAGNSAGSGGSLSNEVGPGGNAGTPPSLKNSILALGTPENCAGTGSLTDAGGNQSTDATCSTFTTVTSAQLNLGPLASNGGPTQTHALLPGSVAIDAAVSCSDVAGATVSTDQRGVNRPVDGDGSTTAECDIGAFEAQPAAATPTPTVTPPPTTPTTPTVTPPIGPGPATAIPTLSPGLLALFGFALAGTAVLLIRSGVNR